MHINKLRVKNFKSIGGKWIEFELGETGLHLMKGANGKGKSTILHAITFGIFGKNSNIKGNSKSSIPTNELINDVNGKDMVVEIHMNDYIVRRGLKPDLFEIIDTKDGKNLADKSSKTIDQKFLENTILGGLNYDMFTKIVFLNSKATSIPFLYMTPTQRKDFIEYILDIRILFFIGEAIKSKVSDTKLDLRDSENKLDTSKQLLESENYKIDQDIIKRKEQEDKVKQLKAQKQDMINGLNENIDIATKKANDSEYEMEKIRGSLAVVDYYELGEKIKESIQKVEDATTKKVREQNTLDIERNTHHKNLEGFELCGDCPTVEKIVGVFDEELYLGKHSDLTASIEIYGEKVDELKVKLTKVEKASTVNFEKETEITGLERIINISKNNIKDFEKQKKKLENFDSIELFEIDYERQKELGGKVDDNEKIFNTNVNKLDQLDRIKKRVTDKSVKKEIFEYYIPLLESKVNEMLEVFFEDDEFSFYIEISDVFDIQGYKNGKKINMFKFSEGQLSSLNFAFLFAFQYILSVKNSFDFKLFMIDEILDIALDANRLDKIVQYLKVISEEKAVMIISHNKSLNTEYFDTISEAVTVNKFSEYIEG